MPSPGFRKLTITLTIVVIVTHPACGFSVHRKTTAEADSGPTTDLTPEESLQVKSVKSPNDIKQSKPVNTNKDTKDKYSFSNGIKFIDSTAETTVNDGKETDSSQDTSVTDMITVQDIMISKNNEESTVSSTLASVSKAINEDLVPAISDKTTSLKSTAISRIKSVENVTNLHTTKPINNAYVTIEENKLSSIKFFPIELENITESTITVSKMVKDITVLPTMNDQIAIDTEATENLTAQKTLMTNLTTQHITETDNTGNTEIKDTRTSPTSSAYSDVEPMTSSKFTGNVLSSEADSTKLQTSVFFDETSNSASTIVEVKVTNDLSLLTTEPSWKKYTTIERNHTANLEETSLSTEKEKDLVKAESIQTTLPIPSLEMFRGDLLSNANQLSTVRESQTEQVSLETEIMPTLELIENTQSETLGTVASRRGGFLDLTKKTSENYQTSTEKNTDYRAEIEATEIKTHEIKITNGYDSQSQLAEDAIKEELLKEEIFSNNDDNAKMYDSANNVNLSSHQDITEDTLSVQPINQDRRTTLYTVGPNYKPMKRLEVQPAKLFVRDPDDNSWRNESISSLGIVFKPKNSSSKSFKEVLKTKTEIELNNLQDKDNKGDTPELRERLEKITEVRKKKKKIDKFGEVVYTDYEESSSAESPSTPKAETTPKGTSYSDIFPTFSTSTVSEAIEVTSPRTTTENQIYWKNKLETINKEEMFKELGLDILTTEKPKKPYNIAEYYDTTDEYDADYVSLSNIDLKKFTIPIKTTLPTQTPPMTPPTTKLKPPRFPERKPTVQYFPPTTKPQKVNVNDYDVNFERRVQSYTLKDMQPPKTDNPHDVYDEVTVSADQPEIRPSVKPSDFTMFTPQPPDNMKKHLYISDKPRVIEPYNVVVNDRNFNRGVYVIKHYRDFLNEATNDEDDDRPPNFVAYTEPPARGVTISKLAIATDKAKTTEEDYEYDNKFQKDVLHRFVDNFNQNSDRFKVDFPVLFNSSVIHRSVDDEGRALASSSAFVKRLYGNEIVGTGPQTRMNKDCEPSCDRTVELSPAYELHYYVPEQEEREVMEQRPATLPDRYQL